MVNIVSNSAPIMRVGGTQGPRGPKGLQGDAGTNGTNGRNAYDFAITIYGDSYPIFIPCYEAQTLALGVPPIGTGTATYAKSSAAAPQTFVTTTMPATMEAGSYLRVTVLGVTTFYASHIRRV